MNLELQWERPIQLKDASKEDLIYRVDDFDKLPLAAGIYVFGRRWGANFEALYVGKARSIRGRVNDHFNNLRLMQHLRNAKTGERVLLAGRLMTKPGQQLDRCLQVAERALIRHFLSEGHDLVNIQGAQLRRHEVASSGRHPKRFFPSTIYLERGKGE